MTIMTNRRRYHVAWSLKLLVLFRPSVGCWMGKSRWPDGRWPCPKENEVDMSTNPVSIFRRKTLTEKSIKCEKEWKWQWPNERLPVKKVVLFKLASTSTEKGKIQARKPPTHCQDRRRSRARKASPYSWLLCFLAVGWLSDGRKGWRPKENKIDMSNRKQMIDYGTTVLFCNRFFEMENYGSNSFPYLKNYATVFYIWKSTTVVFHFWKTTRFVFYIWKTVLINYPYLKVCQARKWHACT